MALVNDVCAGISSLSLRSVNVYNGVCESIVPFVFVYVNALGCYPAANHVEDALN